jgi:hypothetical protein
VGRDGVIVQSQLRYPESFSRHAFEINGFKVESKCICYSTREYTSDKKNNFMVKCFCLTADIKLANNSPFYETAGPYLKADEFSSHIHAL